MLETLSMTVDTREERVRAITVESSPAELLRAAALDDTDASDRAAVAKLLSAVTCVGDLEDIDLVCVCARAHASVNAY